MGPDFNVLLPLPENVDKLPTAILYDLDGFVIDSSVRAAKHIDSSAIAKGDLESFERSLWRFAQTADDDTPISFGVDFVYSLAQGMQPDAMIAITSRNELERENTLAFMEQHFPWEVRSDWLYMNPQKRMSDCGTIVHAKERFDHVPYKRWQLNRIRQQFRVILAGDDHNGVVEMYHEEGITSIRLMHADVDCLKLFGDKIPFTNPTQEN